MENKYTLTLDLNVLNHLGLNLYSNIAAVLSEIVANAWDADAETVNIDIKDDMIIITDDGCGMEKNDINQKFLTVGYEKRKNGEDITPIFSRNVMGRKGIGKLSLFSIADNIEIYSIKNNEVNAFRMNVPEIKRAISEKREYHPIELTAEGISIQKGTKIILTSLKKSANRTESYLRKRIARRFSIIGEEFNFKVVINSNPITVKDRDFYDKLEFIWEVGNEYNTANNCTNLKNKNLFLGTGGELGDFEISGWIGAVENAGHLSEDKSIGLTNNNISLIVRGKLAQEDILANFNEGGLYTKYLIGEISADFLDKTDQEDIATSNRQALKDDDERYQKLLKFVYEILKKVKREWESWGAETGTNKALEKPAIKKWYDRLSSGGKKRAQKLFGTIQKLNVDHESDRNELYKYGILAFERLRIKDSLEELELITDSDDFKKFTKIFADLDSIEAILYYDIASERFRIIKEFEKIVDDKEKESVIQKYIFDHLWLLHPSWERPTEDSRMEQRVTTEFNNVKLTKEEKEGRFDIKYRTAAGKHIIIELKKAERSVGIFELTAQINKYRIALEKCLKHFQKEHEPIEIICLLGKHVKEYQTQPDVVRRQLESVGARIILYDTLIQDSLKSYGDYLIKQKEIGALREIIDLL